MLLFHQVDTPTSTRSDGSPMIHSGIMCGGSLMPLFRLDDDSTEDGHEDDGRHSRALPIRRTGSDDYGGGGRTDGVNWRTGFSGHSALNKGRKSAYKGFRAEFTRSAVRFMGEHRGIGHIKKMYNKGAPSSPSSRDDRSV